MTNEEKAKAYDEAIKRGLDYIRQTPATEIVTRQDVFEAIFPECAESEDEKMVKAITHVLYENYTDAAVIEGVEIAKIVTWLEKQKDLDKMIVVSPEVWDKAIADAYENGKKDNEKQKEQNHDGKKWLTLEQDLLRGCNYNSETDTYTKNW